MQFCVLPATQTLPQGRLDGGRILLSQQSPLQVTVWVSVPTPHGGAEHTQSFISIHTSGNNGFVHATVEGGSVDEVQQPPEQLTTWLHVPAVLPHSPVQGPQLPTSHIPLPVQSWSSVSISPCVPSPSVQASPPQRGAGLSHVRLLVCVHDMHDDQLVHEPHCPSTVSADVKHSSVGMLSTPFIIVPTALLKPCVKNPREFAASTTTVITPASRIRYSVTF